MAVRTSANGDSVFSSAPEFVRSDEVMHLCSALRCLSREEKNDLCHTIIPVQTLGSPMATPD